MSTIHRLESLQEVLQPVGSLQVENEEMSAWIHDSFSALEKLHEELTQWQSELARKETELDLREDANRRLPPTEQELRQRVLDLDAQLTALQTDVSLLEAENSEQLGEFEALEKRYVELEVQFQEARLRIQGLEQELVVAKAGHNANASVPATDEGADGLNLVLEDHIKMLTSQLQKLQSEQEAEDAENLASQAGVSKSAELRRRAQARRSDKTSDE